MPSDHAPPESQHTGLVVLVDRETTLRGSRCAQCRRTEFPALRICPACGHTCEERRLGPHATLAGFTNVLHPPPGAQVEVPYTVAIAAFEDNISVVGPLVPHADVTTLVVGSLLHVVNHELDDGSGTYAFALG